MKCSVCKEKIDETFLNKLVGTYIKKDGKKVPVCSNCQKAYRNDKQKMLDKAPL